MENSKPRPAIYIAIAPTPEIICTVPDHGRTREIHFPLPTGDAAHIVCDLMSVKGIAEAVVEELQRRMDGAAMLRAASDVFPAPVDETVKESEQEAK
jgi:hypothetical protein